MNNLKQHVTGQHGTEKGNENDPFHSFFFNLSNFANKKSFAKNFQKIFHHTDNQMKKLQIKEKGIPTELSTSSAE